jgi:hypothetical protein
VGEVDVFKMDSTHELWGHMNTNYVKLARTPQPPDWSDLLAALRSGDFFVTTGEVLLHDSRIQRAAGEITAEADVEWTFPLNFAELVWGDGSQTHRKLVPLAGTSQFGRRKMRIAEKAPNARWARFAVWDVAANGAFTQPVRFE